MSSSHVGYLPQFFFMLFTETGSLAEPRAHQYDQSSLLLGSRLHLLSVGISSSLSPHPAFYIGSGNPDSSSCLQDRCCIHWAISPAQILYIFNIVHSSWLSYIQSAYGQPCWSRECHAHALACWEDRLEVQWILSCETEERWQLLSIPFCHCQNTPLHRSVIKTV